MHVCFHRRAYDVGVLVQGITKAEVGTARPGVMMFPKYPRQIPGRHC